MAAIGIASLLVHACVSAHGRTISISTPGGVVQLDISHVGPSGGLVNPQPPTAPGFRPPSFFSAPLPTGSGARAFGLGGAFTAVADDATAASWNPGGLLQLERPEASAVFRYSFDLNRHSSRDSMYETGRDDFDSLGLNYVSAVYPFRLAGRNAVFSANYQEAFDFTQSFSARASDLSSETRARTSTATFEDTVETHVEQGSSVFQDGVITVDVTSQLETHATTFLREVIESDMVTDLHFQQNGGIDAITPSLAVEVTPKLSVGASLNIYRGNPFAGGDVRSRTRAAYSGNSANLVSRREERTTSGTYTYTGRVQAPPGGSTGMPIDFPILGDGTIEPHTETTRDDWREGLEFDGMYEETSVYDDFQGLNATLGALWTVSRHLSLGVAVDLPWTAEAEQTKAVHNTLTSYNDSRSRILDVTTSDAVTSSDVEFDFPLCWAVGAVWRWKHNLYTTLDVSETLWSDFAFQAAGQGKLNPFDGSPHGRNDVDDCWAVRCGVEYLWMLTNSEIPLRGGLSWEQRPAIGDPDRFWGASVGSGWALRRGDRSVIFDVAYMCAYGDNVLGSLVPDQPGLTTDVTEHQAFVSCICHF